VIQRKLSANLEKFCQANNVDLNGDGKSKVQAKKAEAQEDAKVVDETNK